MHMNTRGKGHRLTSVQISAPKLLDTQISSEFQVIGGHTHIWINPLKIFSREPNGKHGEPWMTFNLFKVAELSKLLP